MTNVLILDNNSLSRNSLASCLQKKGCRVIETERQSEVLQAVRERDIDVVLLSLTTLKEESMTILMSIKQIRPTTKIILLTSPMDISLSIQGMKLGAFDDLFVPIDVEVLFARVQEASEQKREENGKAGRGSEFQNPLTSPGGNRTEGQPTFAGAAGIEGIRVWFGVAEVA